MMAQSETGLLKRLARARAPKAELDRDRLYFTPPEIAAAIGWKLRRTRDWLKRAGVLEKRHGILVVTAERLQAEFPEVYQRLLGAGRADEDDE